MNELITKPQLTQSGNEKIGEIIGNFDFDDMISDITSGKFSLGADKLIMRIIRLFMGELKISFALMGALISLMLMCAVAENLHKSFGKNGVAEASSYAFFAYASTISIKAFSTVCGYVYETIRDITLLIHGTIPAMAMLLAAGGSFNTAAAAHPIIFFICSTMSYLIRNIITPLIILRAAASLMSALSLNDTMKEFSNLFAMLHKNILTLSMTLFVGILGVSKFAAASFDNLAARGIKFAVSLAVPIVGGSVSEAMSSVAGSAGLLKNAVGITGVIMIFALAASPLIKIGAMSLTYRIAAAVSSPVADKRMTSLLSEMGKCIEMFFSSLVCMGVIMIIAVASIL